jgi:hypothetical protein
LQPRRGDLGSLVAGLIASSALFCIGLLIIAHALSWLGGPVSGLFGKSADTSLWPSDLDTVGSELKAIVPPIIACLFVAVYLLAPRGQVQDVDPALRPDSSLRDELLDFIRSRASLLSWCILTAVLIKIGQLFHEYGTLHLPSEARSLSRLTLPVIQSFIAFAICLFTTWYLVASARTVPRRGGSFVGTMLIVAGVTGFIALLYDLTFMAQYLKVHPEYRPSGDHVLFSVVANALVAVCAFASIAVFFKARSRLGKPARPVNAADISD